MKEITMWSHYNFFQSFSLLFQYHVHFFQTPHPVDFTDTHLSKSVNLWCKMHYNHQNTANLKHCKMHTVYYVLLYPLFLHSLVLQCKSKETCMTPRTQKIYITICNIKWNTVNMKFSYMPQDSAMLHFLWYTIAQIKCADTLLSQYSKWNNNTWDYR